MANIKLNHGHEADELRLKAQWQAEALSKPFDGLPGCGDSSCVVRKPEGMHTNGGCRCLKGTTASIIVQRLAALRDEAGRQAEEADQ